MKMILILLIAATLLMTGVTYTAYKKAQKLESQVSEIVSLINSRVSSLENTLVMAQSATSDVVNTLEITAGSVSTIHKSISVITKRLDNMMVTVENNRKRVVQLRESAVSRLYEGQKEAEDDANEFIKSLVE